MIYPKVSILICAYNSWNYIKNTIQSVLNQTYDSFELLILDNNSSDQTIKNIESFKDNRIKLFKSDKNLWSYWWLNFLLKKAKWEYIAIQDHDDLRHPLKIEKQINFLKENRELIGCGTTCKMLFEYDWSYFNYKFPERSFYVIHPSLIFKNRPGLLYDEKEFYMWDAFFQKKILCLWEKKLWTIDEILTTHIIQWNYNNASFSWFKINKSCIKRLFYIHSFWYAFLSMWFELLRKALYPMLKANKQLNVILWLEQLPFLLMGYKIYKN